MQGMLRIEKNARIVPRFHCVRQPQPLVLVTQISI
jgi:hypothetical protein